MTLMGRRRRAAWLMGWGMALALVGVACGGNGSSSSGGTPATTSPGRGGGGYGYGSSPGASPSGGGPAALTVSQINFRFNPSSFSVKQNDTIEVKDTNPTTPHTFTVDGQNIDVSLNPGESLVVPINLPPGTYQFHCRFHAFKGMKGSFTVT